MFEKLRAVKAAKKQKEQDRRAQIKKDKNDLQEKTLFQSKMTSTLKEVSFLLSVSDQIESVDCLTDNNSKSFVDSFITSSEFMDYIFKENEQNTNKYNIKLVKLDL